jgi:ATP-dependent Clp protease ATP-binding subunit ClpA
VETEHLMLSILKNKENIATQILNQFEIDYDIFRNELGMVKSNDPRAEYDDPGEEDFDDEKSKYSQSRSKQQAGAKAKRQCWIILVEISHVLLKMAHWIPLLAVKQKLSVYHKSFHVVKRTTRFDWRARCW